MTADPSAALKQLTRTFKDVAAIKAESEGSMKGVQLVVGTVVRDRGYHKI